MDLLKLLIKIVQPIINFVRAIVQPIVTTIQTGLSNNPRNNSSQSSSSTQSAAAARQAAETANKQSQLRQMERRTQAFEDIDQKSLDTHAAAGLWMLVDQDAQKVLRTIQQIPGIFGAASATPSSPDVTLEYLWANGPRLARDKFLQIVEKAHPNFKPSSNRRTGQGYPDADIQRLSMIAQLARLHGGRIDDKWYELDGSDLGKLLRSERMSANTTRQHIIGRLKQAGVYDKNPGGWSMRLDSMNIDQLHALDTDLSELYKVGQTMRDIPENLRLRAEILKGYSLSLEDFIMANLAFNTLSIAQLRNLALGSPGHEKTDLHDMDKFLGGYIYSGEGAMDDPWIFQEALHNTTWQSMVVTEMESRVYMQTGAHLGKNPMWQRLSIFEKWAYYKALAKAFNMSTGPYISQPVAIKDGIPIWLAWGLAGKWFSSDGDNTSGDIPLNIPVDDPAAQQAADDATAHDKSSEEVPNSKANDDKSASDTSADSPPTAPLGGYGVAANVPNLSGKTIAEADAILRSFNPTSVSDDPMNPGNSPYIYYTFADKSEVIVNVDNLDIDRISTRIYNPDGSRADRGWRIDPNTGNLARAHTFPSETLTK